MTYRIRDRDIQVDAFQLTAAQYATRTDWPEWLRTAMPRMKAGVLGIRSPHGTVPAQVNDWVIRDKDGALWVQKPDAFALHYVEVT